MTDMAYQNPDRIMGPYGEQITMSDLPPSNTKRWVIRRKALVVAAVRGGLISLEEACRRYTLSVEEFLSWQQAIDRHGLPGLRTTRTQLYRDSDQEHEEKRDDFQTGNNLTAAVPA
ncbi:MAG: DUF1153 domain-containing protein [Alphaproteobacteria bacterium]|nr:DUF1153 domain-containing protein [Alphaproteobacteria bacterium]